MFITVAVLAIAVIAEFLLAGKPEYRIPENGIIENFQRFVLLLSGVICIIAILRNATLHIAFASVFLAALSFSVFVREAPFCDDKWGISLDCIGQSANILIITSFVILALLFSLWAVFKAPEIIAPMINMRWSWPTFLAVFIGLLSQVCENMHYLMAEEVLETGCYVIILIITILLLRRQTWTGFDAYISNQGKVEDI